MQGGPRRRRIERRIEKFLHPCRKQIFCRTIPCIAKRPHGACCRAWPRRFVATHGDLTRTVAACERRPPCPGGGGLHLGKPEIWWAAEALTRFRRHVSIRPNQREFALDRALGGKDDSQGRAFPRRNRRSQDRNVSILAGIFGLGWCNRGGQDCARDQQRCCHGSGKACCKH